MHMITKKKTAFGIAGVAAAAALTLGFAAPAMADGHHGGDSNGWSTTSSTESTSTANRTSLLRMVSIAPETATWAPVVVAPSVSTGDVLSGNETASGDSVGSNDPIASGDDVSSMTGDINSSVRGLVGDITGALGLGGGR